MIKEKLQRLGMILQHPRVLFYLGLVATIAFSLAAVIADRTTIFRIFRWGTLYAWQGINPYTHWAQEPDMPSYGLDVFLYAPLFSVLFYPLAILPLEVGALLWSSISYVVLLRAMRRLPHWAPSAEGTKRFAFLFFYVIVVMISSLKEFQYNVLTAACCLWVFIYLEREAYIPAMLIVIVGGLTKVYAGFCGVLFLFYPQFWKEPKWLLWGAGLGLGALLLPALYTGIERLVPYYIDWFSLMESRNLLRFHGVTSFIYVVCKWPAIVEYTTWILLGGTLCPLLYYGLFLRKKVKNNYALRATLLGLIMLGMMVWGNSTEANTYIIGMLGWLLFYTALPEKRGIDYALCGVLFIAFGVLPMDFLCPPRISHIILHEWKMGAVGGFVCWLGMFFSLKRVASS